MKRTQKNKNRIYNKFNDNFIKKSKQILENEIEFFYYIKSFDFKYKSLTRK